MAKWGEGDPRWIVEERPDATNVNNWHWTEKNADSWSKKKLEDLLVNQVIMDPKAGNIFIEEMSKCEGEARVNNRKAKLIFFYEWELELKWKGYGLQDAKHEITGKIEIPNLSEEHDNIQDVDLNITITSNTKSGEAGNLKESLRKGDGAKHVRGQLQAYVDALKQEYSQNLILPNKEGVGPPKSGQKPVGSNLTRASVVTAAATDGFKALDIGCGLKTGTIEMEETFKCTAQEIYNALTQKEMMQVFTQGEVKLSAGGPDVKKGTAFQMLGGNISGVYKELTPFTKIVQQWRLKGWQEGHHSEVTMTIRQTMEETKVSVVQTGVPDKEMDNTQIGWHKYYWEAIKRSFGFGASLY